MWGRDNDAQRKNMPKGNDGMHKCVWGTLQVKGFSLFLSERKESADRKVSSSFLPVLYFSGKSTNAEREEIYSFKASHTHRHTLPSFSYKHKMAPSQFNHAVVCLEFEVSELLKDIQNASCIKHLLIVLTLKCEQEHNARSAFLPSHDWLPHVYISIRTAVFMIRSALRCGFSMCVGTIRADLRLLCAVNLLSGCDRCW